MAIPYWDRHDNKRTPREREADLKEIFRLREEGMTWKQLTDIINSKRPYTLDVNSYYSQYFRYVNDGIMDINVEDAKKEQLADLQRVKHEAFNAWLESKGHVDKITKRGIVEGVEGKKSGEEHLTKHELTIVKTFEAGGAQYLSVYLKALEREAKITGTDAPEKKDVNVVNPLMLLNDLDGLKGSKGEG